MRVFPLGLGGGDNAQTSGFGRQYRKFLHIPDGKLAGVHALYRRITEPRVIYVAEFADQVMRWNHKVRVTKRIWIAVSVCRPVAIIKKRIRLLASLHAAMATH